ncbi:unnamed protein product [Eruca vesicaria subsp. sativa]|uniref:Uncharacterized protein n=1 Tax=Eruca vesicaria subsp. sativa TaxID=29727 RepID=A0ABC8INE1_ERUVS|nr:unnamed protein product [Eruca vesicaria subsp. sativa]
MDGNMRRLPPWMLTGASSSVGATSNITDNKSAVVKIKDEAEEHPKTKKKRKTREERDDSEEHKKVEIRKRGVRRKIKEEEVKPKIDDDGKSPKIIQSLTCPEADEEDFTVDDLLSFAQEYIKREVDKAREIQTSLSTSGSNMISSQGETNGTRDPTSDDMINLLLGPFFKKSGTN